jgi:fission process protein 1
VAHPWLIRSAYAVSWSYLTADVVHEGYKAYIRNQKVLHPERYQGESIAEHLSKEKTGHGHNPAADLVPGKVDLIDDYRVVMGQRAVFQSIASMGLPAFTIHSIVRYSGQALKNVKNTTIRSYAPIGVSLA